MTRVLLLAVFASCATTPPPRGSTVTERPIAGFYCNALSQCWTSETECPQCTKKDVASCAVYQADDGQRLACGVSRQTCHDLLRDLRVHDHGECVQRTASSP